MDIPAHSRCPLCLFQLRLQHPPIVSSHRIARLVVVESTRVRWRLWLSVRRRLFVLLFTPRDWFVLLVVLRGRESVFERRSWLCWRTCNSISKQLGFSIHAVAGPFSSALDVRECLPIDASSAMPCCGGDDNKSERGRV